MGGVVISPNIKKERVRLDRGGNEIDPRTKQIVKPKEQEYVPTPEELANIAKAPTTVLSEPNKSIKEQIVEAESHLAQLKELRKAEIERMRKELEELENE